MSNYEVGSLILRVVTGITFLVHGWAKLQGGIENTVEFFQAVGLPVFLAYAVTWIELIGGIALILGLGTRIIAVLFAAIMAGAIVTVKGAAGFMGDGQMAGYELDLILLAVNIHFIISGSRWFALDSLFGKNNKAEETEAS